MTNFAVVYDACVLYPAPLRDFLMRLALTDLFRAKWTEAIHQEWIRNVLANRPDLTAEQLGRTKTLMDSHVRDALVTGYEYLIPGLELPDPDDRHVLAAAIRSQSSLIVTFNLKEALVHKTTSPPGLTLRRTQKENRNGNARIDHRGEPRKEAPVPGRQLAGV